MMTHRIESSSAQQCMSQQQCATRRQVCALHRARRAGQQPGFLLCKRAGRRNAQGCRVVGFDCAQRGWFRTRAPSDARCVCSSPLGRPRPFECGPSRADRRSGHCARSRRSLRPHFSIVRCVFQIFKKNLQLWTDNPGPPEFRQKAEKVKITVGSRRENFPHETSVEFKNICTRPKKSLVWTFPRRDPTGKLTFFYPAASCRNSGGPDFLSAAVLGADFRI